jgi:hypothetical protein
MTGPIPRRTLRFRGARGKKIAVDEPRVRKTRTGLWNRRIGRRRQGPSFVEVNDARAGSMPHRATRFLCGTKAGLVRANAQSFIRSHRPLHHSRGWPGWNDRSNEPHAAAIRTRRLTATTTGPRVGGTRGRAVLLPQGGEFSPMLTCRSSGTGEGRRERCLTAMGRAGAFGFTKRADAGGLWTAGMVKARGEGVGRDALPEVPPGRPRGRGRGT